MMMGNGAKEERVAAATHKVSQPSVLKDLSFLSNLQYYHISFQTLHNV